MAQGENMTRLRLKSMTRARSACAKLSGQGSIEWTLIVALIGILLVAGLFSLQSVMGGKITDLGNVLTSI